MSGTLSRTRHTFRGPVVLALGALLAVLLPTAGAAAGPAPVATSIVVTSFGTDDVVVPTTDGAPAAYIVKDKTFTMSLCFVGAGATVTDYAYSGTTRKACTPANGALPLSYNKNVALSLTTAGHHAGSWTVNVPKNTSSATFSGTFTAAANDISIDLSNDARKADEIVTGSTGLFDVLVSSGLAAKDALLTSITSGGATATACDATSEDPVCADLMVNGQATTDGLLSIGLCDFDLCAGNLVQVLVGLSGDRSNPAALIMKCDKTLCGGGGIKDVPLYVTLGADDTPSTPASPCPAKGTVGQDQTFCVDYVQSTRDNAGDTILYLLFVQDAKVRFS